MDETLQQIGRDLVAADGTLTWAQKKEMAATPWESLKKPVGGLKGRNK
jgi:hypothetical protein